MAKRQKQNPEEFILDIENGGSKEPDLLTESNKRVLSVFGRKAVSENSPILEMISAKKNSSPLDHLKKRMGVKTNSADESELKSDEKKAVAQTENEIGGEIKTDRAEPEKASVKAENTEKVGNITADKKESAEVSKNETENTGASADGSDKDGEITLLEKLKRYTTDETGHNVTEDKKPLYKLQSVAEIIKKDNEALLNKLSEKYEVTVDTLGKPPKDDYLLDGVDEEKQPEKADSSKPTPTAAFKNMSKESKKRFEKNLFDEFLSESKPEEPKTAESIPDISDIDNTHMSGGEPDSPEKISNTATIRFTPITDHKGNTGKISISSTTKPIDINQELTNTEETEEAFSDMPFEAGDFDLFVPKNEVTDVTSAKSVLRKLAFKKRRVFLSCVICGACVLALLTFFTPLFSSILIGSTASAITVCSILLFLSVAVNADMFTDVMNLLKKRASHDSVMSLCAVLCLPLCILAIANGENIFHLILLATLLMFTRSVTTFMETSALLSNLRQISGKSQRYAVSFINDKSTALAMSKDAIEGDVLIAAPRKAEFISDYMKYSSFKKKFSGKITVIFAVTCVLCLLGAIISAFYYKNAFSAFYSAAVTAMIAAAPAICFVDVLPMFYAAKHLNKTGAMLTGTFGADRIELSNAVVVNSSDIFPKGTITLKNLKVLSDNDIDKTIVNAAALTEAINSPLFPVFSQIANTNASYEKPDSDTIKYEETLGISGWVDDKLLFIGNRSLLEGHGIDVPSIEVDRNILRNGCFPIYVAVGDRACALLVLRYEVRNDVRKVLRKMSKLGVTMLVNNCDPNISESMLCDYFGLYDDSVKVMTNVGTYMCNNATAETSVISAPAGFRGNKLNLLRIVGCASDLRVSNNILSVLYLLSAVLGVWYFAFSSFAQSGTLLSGASILLFELIATLFSFIAFLFRKP